MLCARPQTAPRCHASGCVTTASPGLCDFQTEYFVMGGIFWTGTLPCLPAAAISWHFIVVLALSCSSSHACRQYLQA